MTSGSATASDPGMIISRREDFVDMSTHFAYSGTTPSLPSRRPGISRNCRRTSSIISNAARPTAWMVIAANRYGNMPPMKRPMATLISRMLNCSTPTALENVKNRASAVTAAEAMANPFATAAVVLPSASS